jgi:hypothetical protein
MSKPIITNVRKTTIKAFSLGIITGGFIAAGTIAAFPAKASPSLEQIAVQEEPYVCNTLSLKPTVSTLVRVMGVVQSTENLGDQDTGTVVAIAIIDGCDQHLPVVKRFIAMYAPGATA